jgi:hypothetical protein
MRGRLLGRAEQSKTPFLRPFSSQVKHHHNFSLNDGASSLHHFSLRYCSRRLPLTGIRGVIDPWCCLLYMKNRTTFLVLSREFGNSDFCLSLMKHFDNHFIGSQIRDSTIIMRSSFRLRMTLLAAIISRISLISMVTRVSSQRASKAHGFAGNSTKCASARHITHFAKRSTGSF